MPHFNDHNMSIEDIRDLLKKIKTNLRDARTRFVRTIPALKGLYEETTDPAHRVEIEKLMAHLAFIVDAIDGKVQPHIEELDDEDFFGRITQRHIDRWLDTNAE